MGLSEAWERLRREQGITFQFLEFSPGIPSCHRITPQHPARVPSLSSPPKATGCRAENRPAAQCWAPRRSFCSGKRLMECQGSGPISPRILASAKSSHTLSVVGSLRFHFTTSWRIPGQRMVIPLELASLPNRRESCCICCRLPPPSHGCQASRGHNLGGKL